MPKFTILSGHGSWDGFSAFTVPKGKRIHFLVAHGHTVYDFRKLNRKLEKYRKDPDLLYEALMPYVHETVEAGESCYDYNLSRPKGLTTFKNHKYVREQRTNTRLSELLSYSRLEDITDMFWYACRANTGSIRGGDTAEEARFGVLVSASTSIERMLMSGSSSSKKTSWDGGYFGE
ncbi:MAG TPA: hypothetical protein VF665_13590 [Longimicrobium sp.]|jgi:hypothetical protein|uniref:putative adhesin n=1 Tax=Longimicrobium sp. TaxID=2029185 RepID=UPI002ED9BE49